MLDNCSTKPVYDTTGKDIEGIEGFKSITRAPRATMVLNLCGFCSFPNAIYTTQDGAYRIVYKSSNMTYVKYDKDGAQAEGVISKCPVCHKDLTSTKENWKLVDGQTGYEVSDKGRIKSYVQDPEGKLGVGGYTEQGYKLQNFNHGRCEYVHRLVAKAFIPNDFNFDCINHKNHFRDDNRVDNLEWCTYQYNNVGIHRPRYFGKDDVIAQVKNGKIIATYHSYKEAAEKTGISRVSITYATRGVMPQAGGFMWQIGDDRIKSRKEKQHDRERFMLRNIG